MRNLLLVLFVLTSLSVIAQLEESNDYTQLLDQKYGEAERNTFDIIMPQSNKPVALVIFIHGGGFQFGDKKKAYERKNEIDYYLDNNIAFATINYTFYRSDDSLGVQVCLDDVQRAIQYFKYNANQYNIDKNKVACYGVSAGAGASLYFALNDDLADEKAEGLRAESTKIVCAGAIHTQATYDVYKWKSFIPYLGIVQTLKNKMFLNYAAAFYGYPDKKSIKPYRKEIAAKYDMLTMVDENDPPIYLLNPLKGNFPKDYNIIFHHKKHAEVMAKELEKKKVEYYCVTSPDYKENTYTIEQFIIEKLAL